MQQECSAENCHRPRKTRGLCHRHYTKARRRGELGLHKGVGRGRWAPPERKSCSGVRECGKKLVARGLCGGCYQVRMRNGIIDRKPTVNAGKRCKVPGCKSKRCVARGMCSSHYRRLVVYGDPLASCPKKTGGECTIANCGSVVVANGVCRKHYERIKRNGKAALSPRYMKRFEKVTDDNGYVMVPLKGHPNARKSGRVPEHRLVMSQMIGRALLPGENVHHKNGRRDDNRPANLELWARTQPSGQRPADIVAWANEMLSRYPKELLAALDPKARVAA